MGREIRLSDVGNSIGCTVTPSLPGQVLGVMAQDEGSKNSRILFPCPRALGNA